MVPDTTCPRCEGTGADYDNGPLYGNGGDSGIPSSYYPLCRSCEGAGEVCACGAPPSGECECREVEEAPDAVSLGVSR